MTDYRDLSRKEQLEVDKYIKETIEPGHFINEHNGYEWDEPISTLKDVRSGYSCAKCLRSYYTCLCSHDD